MSESPDSLSRIWSELKRRKVIKAAAMYAATAYIIIEASDIILPRLGLPDWTVTFLIILLIIGFPITLILSWIFDVTPEGVQKTESIEEDATQAEVPEKKERNLKISDFVIAVLFTIVCILAYPRLFQRNQLDDLRDEKGMISVSVMPFENLTGDSLYNVWQGGFQNLMISILSNSEELQVRQYQTMSGILSQRKDANQAALSPAMARELALDLETKTFVLGRILKAGDRIRIDAQLLNAETGEIYRTYQVDGSAEEDAFLMADSLAWPIRNYLEIKKLSREYGQPQANETAYTDSPEAFRYFIYAYEAYSMLEINTTIRWLQKSIEVDPDFIDALVLLSLSYTAILNGQDAEIWCDKAYVHREKLPFRERLRLDHLYAYMHETPSEEIGYCKQILELDDMNSGYWLMLGAAYNKQEQYGEAIRHFEKVMEIHEKWETLIPYPHLFIWMGEALHKTEDHRREMKLYELGLQTIPDNPYLLITQIGCALSRGNEEEAEEYIQKFRQTGSRVGWPESSILGGIGSSYYSADRPSEAESYFQKALDLDPEDPFIITQLAQTIIDLEKDLEKGVVLAKKAIALSPDHFMPHKALGWGLYKQGKYEEGLVSLQKAWELRGPYDPDLMHHIEEVEKALKESLQ